MKKVIIFLLLASISCSVTKEVKNQVTDNDCLILLDSVINLMQYQGYGVYSLNYKNISVEEYKGKEEMDLIMAGIPLDEKTQKIFKFTKLFKSLIIKQECYDYIERNIISSKLKNNYEINKAGNIYIKIDLGGDCPDCNQPIRRIFEGCNWALFEFEQNKLIRIKYLF